jgi:pre-mRNA-splicing factor ISY1
VRNLATCEKWRKRICDEIDQKLEKLYNEPLPEAETRYLNDEVNRILQEIRRWEIRIVELGGIDYSRVSHQTPTGDMLNTAVNHYQYFGRAKELPGVKELLEAERQQRLDAANLGRKINRDALMKKVDLRYYGLMEDVELERAERKIEIQLGAFSDLPILERNSEDSGNDAVRAADAASI